MKNVFLFALCALALAACGGGGKSTSAPADSVSGAESSLNEDSPGDVAYYLTNDGIGPIYVGMPVNEVPDSIAGLFSKKVYGTTGDAVSTTFINNGGESFIAYDFGEDKVDVLNLIGPEVKVKAPEGDFGLGDTFSKVLELPGVTPEWSGYDNNCTWYWVWEGLWFAPSQETSGETLSRLLYNNETAPTAEDFGENVTIGFIGTGLPF